MIDIRRKKVKAIYFNAFHCPECGLELYKDNITLTTYPAQYCYYCECGFRTTSSQLPGYEYEFEDEEDNSTPIMTADEVLTQIADLYTALGNSSDEIEALPLSGFIHCEEPYYRERGF